MKILKNVLFLNSVKFSIKIGYIQRLQKWQSKNCLRDVKVHKIRQTKQKLSTWQSRKLPNYVKIRMILSHLDWTNPDVMPDFPLSQKLLLCKSDLKFTNSLNLQTDFESWVHWVHRIIVLFTFYRLCKSAKNPTLILCRFAQS